jgi:hypothetical protein
MKSGIRSDPEQWTDERHKRGLAGEEKAIRYLQSRGWDIVAHRFRVGRVEVDLVARRGQLVAFVEVKVRQREPVRGGHRGQAARDREGSPRLGGPVRQAVGHLPFRLYCIGGT